MNGKVKKKYEIDTPLGRVLKIESIPEEIKQNLKNLREKIDIVKLTKGIVYLTEKLKKVYQTKRRKEKCLLEIE